MSFQYVSNFITPSLLQVEEDRGCHMFTIYEGSSFNSRNYPVTQHLSVSKKIYKQHMNPVLFLYYSTKLQLDTTKD